MTAQAGSASSSSVAAESRDALRHRFRIRRAALSAAERAAAARGIARVLSRSRLLRPGMRIGSYVAIRGEADPALFVAKRRIRPLTLFLPRITRTRGARMDFVPHAGAQALVAGRFGIPEPSRSAARCTLRSLDRVLVPLVAFDLKGNRLGMGAGFYDRALRILARHPAWRRPRLIGIAYDWQCVPALDARPWDVPLDWIATERRLYRVRR